MQSNLTRSFLILWHSVYESQIKKPEIQIWRRSRWTKGWDAISYYRSEENMTDKPWGLFFLREWYFIVHTGNCRNRHSKDRWQWFGCWWRHASSKPGVVVWNIINVWWWWTKYGSCFFIFPFEVSSLGVWNMWIKNFLHGCIFFQCKWCLKNCHFVNLKNKKKTSQVSYMRVKQNEKTYALGLAQPSFLKRVGCLNGLKSFTFD